MSMPDLHPEPDLRHVVSARAPSKLRYFFLFYGKRQTRNRIVRDCFAHASKLCRIWTMDVDMNVRMYGMYMFMVWTKRFMIDAKPGLRSKYFTFLWNKKPSIDPAFREVCKAEITLTDLDEYVKRIATRRAPGGRTSIFFTIYFKMI